MDKKFFDESIFNSMESEESSFASHESLVFHLKKHNNSYQFYVENNSERLNSSELKALIKLNETENFLSENNVTLLNYLNYQHIHSITRALFKQILNLACQCLMTGMIPRIIFFLVFLIFRMPPELHHQKMTSNTHG